MKLKYILIFLSGLGLGGAAGFILASRRCKALYDAKLDEMDKEYAEATKRVAEPSVASQGHSVKEGQDELEQLESEMSEEDKIRLGKITDQIKQMQGYGLTDSVSAGSKDVYTEYTDYTKFSKDLDPKTTPSSGDLRGNTRVILPPDYGPDEHDLIFEEFGDQGYKEVQATYFAGDDILVLDGAMIMIDIDEVVGRAALGRFDEYEKGVVYVRNDELETDYEITYDDRSFELVIGDNDNPGNWDE